MVFLLTYGFVGLEVVAIELDNPFGRDPNDFNIRYVCLEL
jgi:predicted membrane chloride channel (bestrophin family)